jgi:hypothetical protein
MSLINRQFQSIPEASIECFRKLLSILPPSLIIRRIQEQVRLITPRAMDRSQNYQVDYLRGFQYFLFAGP